MIRFGLVVAACVALLDQATKWLILEQVMRPPRVIELTPFFNIVLVWNRGVSFGMLNDAGSWGRWLLAGLALAILVALVVWLTRATDRLLAAGIGLVIGGAVGNVIDRIRFGAVVDFLDFHAGTAHWPAFNVADSAITIGVGLLLYDALIARRRSP